MYGGYVMVWAPEHFSLKGTGKTYILEHRLVMEQDLGRALRKGETVHHRDGNKTNNDRTNLELWSSYHPYGQRVSEKPPHCPTCTCFADAAKES